MKWFFKRAQKNALKLKKLRHLSKEELVYHAFPHFLGEIMAKYFRIKIEGSENIPKKGKGLITSNHSGYSGMDAFLLCHHIYDEVKRTPRVLTHHFWFLTKATSIPATKLGFIEAKSGNGVDTLYNEKLLLIFPEGEKGNFKPTTERYNLQLFKTGLVRMALETGAPIIPTLVIGAEETHINLANLKFTKYVRLLLPLPLNIIPLPARWKIIFLPRFKLKYGREALRDEEKAQELSKDLQKYMQEKLNEELKKRKWIFL